MDEDELKKMLANSLCFGVYILPASSSDIAGTFTFPFIVPVIPAFKLVRWLMMRS
jgi:hypothetical protein